MTDVVASAAGLRAGDCSVAAVAFAFLDASTDPRRLDDAITDEIGRALSAKCRFVEPRDDGSRMGIVFALAGTGRTLAIDRDTSLDVAEQALANTLVDLAAVALINASRLSAARAETAQAREGLRDGLLRFARLGKAGMLGVVVSTLEPTITDINETLSELIGYSREEILARGFDWSKLTPDEFRLSDARARVELHASGTAPLREKQYIRKDGRRVWVMVGSTMLDDTSTISFVIDIDERKTRELDYRLRLGAIVESSADAMLSKTLDGVITTWNQGACDLFGYSAAEAIGQPVTMLIPPGREHEEIELLAKLRAGETTRFESVRRHKLGHDIEVAVTSSPIFDSRHVVIGASKVARDISQRRSTERALASAKDAADAANRELQTFSYSVAHDLRAPLRVIDAFSQLVLDDYADKVDAEGRGHLAEIRSNTKRMSNLIDALLALSQVTSAPLHHARVDLAELAATTARGLALAEPGRDVRVDIRGPLEVDGDPSLLRAMIDNLVGNAWKFTRDAAAATIEVGRDADVYFVRDNGAGFDMAYAKKLFGAFQRMHSMREFPGTGVGLATVQRIVHRHGGRIWADSEVGAGTTMFFTLPPSPGSP